MKRRLAAVIDFSALGIVLASFNAEAALAVPQENSSVVAGASGDAMPQHFPYD
jgi:hypothetical protein